MIRRDELAQELHEAYIMALGSGQSVNQIWEEVAGHALNVILQSFLKSV